MTDRAREYIKLNTSLATCSSKPPTDEDGNYQARIELRLPQNLVSPAYKPKSVKLQVSKLKASLANIPVNTIPVQKVTWSGRAGRRFASVQTKGIAALWPFTYLGCGVWKPQTDAFTSGIHAGYPFDRNYPVAITNSNYIRIPQEFLPAEEGHTIYYDNVINNGYQFKSAEEVFKFFVMAWNTALSALTYRYGDARGGLSVECTANDFIMKLNTRNMTECYAVFAGTQPTNDTNEVPHINDPPPATQYENQGVINDIYYNRSVNIATGVIGDFIRLYTYEYSMVVNKHIRDLLPFLPWIQIDTRKLASVQVLTDWSVKNFGDPYAYALDTAKASITKEVDPMIYKRTFFMVTDGSDDGAGAYPPRPWNVPDDPHHPNNLQGPVTEEEMITSTIITYTFHNVPSILMSNLQSLVLCANGINVLNQIHPINMKLPQGSSLTTTIPIITLYYPMTDSITHLKDEVIVSKDDFENNALTSMELGSLTERAITFSLKYITKDGAMHDVTIPVDGVFAIQLTLGLYY